MISYAKTACLSRYGSFLLNECPFRPSTGIPILQIYWEIEVYWCIFDETVEVFVSIPPEHFYVICCMELLIILLKANPFSNGNWQSQYVLFIKMLQFLVHPLLADGSKNCSNLRWFIRKFQEKTVLQDVNVFVLCHFQWEITLKMT